MYLVCFFLRAPRLRTVRGRLAKEAKPPPPPSLHTPTGDTSRGEIPMTVLARRRFMHGDMYRRQIARAWPPFALHHRVRHAMRHSPAPLSLYLSLPTPCAHLPQQPHSLPFITLTQQTPPPIEPPRPAPPLAKHATPRHAVPQAPACMCLIKSAGCSFTGRGRCCVMAGWLASWLGGRGGGRAGVHAGGRA